MSRTAQVEKVQVPDIPSGKRTVYVFTVVPFCATALHVARSSVGIHTRPAGGCLTRARSWPESTQTCHAPRVTPPEPEP